MISKEVIEIFRTPSEYIQWFTSLLEAIRSDRTQNEAALLHEGIYKQLYEELFPLYSLLKNKQQEWNESLFRNVLGNQSYDVEIKNNSIAYLEIATTDYDDGELLRMHKFLANKYVSLSGKITRDDKNRPISIEDEMRSHEGIVRESRESISKRIESKSEKVYQDNTGLIVYFDDYVTQYDQDDYNMLRSAVDELKPKWNGTFEAVYLVGPKGETLVEAIK